MTRILDQKNQQKKKLLEWHHCFLLSRSHEPCFTIQSQGIEQTKPMKPLIFILKFLWCSNNMMKKMTSITPSIYEIHCLEVFFKIFTSKFWPILGLGNPTVGPVHLGLLHPSAISSPCSSPFDTNKPANNVKTNLEEAILWIYLAYYLVYDTDHNHYL